MKIHFLFIQLVIRVILAQTYVCLNIEYYALKQILLIHCHENLQSIYAASDLGGLDPDFCLFKHCASRHLKTVNKTLAGCNTEPCYAMYA